MAKELEKKGGVSLVESLQSKIEDIERADPERLDMEKFAEKTDALLLLEEAKLKKERYAIENEKDELFKRNWHEGETEPLKSQWDNLNDLSGQLNNIERNAKVNVLEGEKKEIKKLDWNGQRSAQIINLTGKQIEIARPDLNENTVKQIAHFHEANRLDVVAYKHDHPSDKVIVQKLTIAADIFRSQAKGYERAARVPSPIKHK